MSFRPFRGTCELQLSAVLSDQTFYPSGRHVDRRRPGTGRPPVHSRRGRAHRPGYYAGSSPGNRKTRAPDPRRPWLSATSRNGRLYSRGPVPSDSPDTVVVMESSHPVDPLASPEDNGGYAGWRLCASAQSTSRPASPPDSSASPCFAAPRWSAGSTTKSATSANAATSGRSASTGRPEVTASAPARSSALPATPGPHLAHHHPVRHRRHVLAQDRAADGRLLHREPRRRVRPYEDRPPWLSDGRSACTGDTRSLRPTRAYRDQRHRPNGQDAFRPCRICRCPTCLRQRTRVQLGASTAKPAPVTFEV